MLKQINPEDLKVGQKYLVEMEFRYKEGTLYPLNFIDSDGGNKGFSKDQPIYTIDNQPQKPDPELEMLVNVASRLHSAYLTSDLAIPSQDEIVRKASAIIAACKRIKEGER